VPVGPLTPCGPVVPVGPVATEAAKVVCKCDAVFAWKYIVKEVVLPIYSAKISK